MSIEAVVAELKEERSRLDRAIEALEALSLPNHSGKALSAAVHLAPAAKKRRGLTPAGRKRLSELAKQRWAERRKQQLVAQKGGKP